MLARCEVAHLSKRTATNHRDCHCYSVFQTRGSLFTGTFFTAKRRSDALATPASCPRRRFRLGALSLSRRRPRSRTVPAAVLTAICLPCHSPAGCSCGGGGGLGENECKEPRKKAAQRRLTLYLCEEMGTPRRVSSLVDCVSRPYQLRQWSETTDTQNQGVCVLLCREWEG